MRLKLYLVEKYKETCSLEDHDNNYYNENEILEKGCNISFSL